MAEQSERIERLIAAQTGACCTEDVEERIETLDGYAEALPSPSEADLRALRTLGNETRHAIVRLLVAADRELCVCEITPVIDVSESAVSHALSDLRDAGLITRRRDGTWRYYEATDRATALLETLDATREDA